MVDGRQFKDDVFGYFARMGAAFGHAKRVEIIDVLAQGEHKVEQLAEQISASVANTSRHLQILSAAGLVSRRVRGSARVYRLTDPGVEVGYRTLLRLAEVASLTDAFFADADSAQPRRAAIPNGATPDDRPAAAPDTQRPDQSAASPTHSNVGAANFVVPGTGVATSFCAVRRISTMMLSAMSSCSGSPVNARCRLPSSRPYAALNMSTRTRTRLPCG